MDKVFFIMGCTACGKAALGRELARRFAGRILSVDSMKVYRRMNIGTASPPEEILREIPHYGIDVVEPSEPYSVAEFVAHADDAIRQTNKDGKKLFAVGGTSLYIKALTEGLFEAPRGNEEIREQLREEVQQLGLAKMHEQLTLIDPVAAERIHPNDEKRVIRALEVFRQTGTPISELQKQWDAGRQLYDYTLIGLRREKQSQSRRINARVKKMVEMGLKEEVESLLAEDLPLSPQAAQAVGYAELIDHFNGKCSFDKAIEQIKINTRRLAKKQRTWHRRWSGVTWFDIDDNDTVETIADRVMAKIAFD